MIIQAGPLKREPYSDLHPVSDPPDADPPVRVDMAGALPMATHMRAGNLSQVARGAAKTTEQGSTGTVSISDTHGWQACHMR